tara:strand:+ start:585 stop:764 length:180 start_codon:yes stop_codon:yes gene_type:complete
MEPQQIRKALLIRLPEARVEVMDDRHEIEKGISGIRVSYPDGRALFFSDWEDLLDWLRA